ncbi:hypothetical protein NP493_56g00031 [Ridgeia piscesae]|uniref:Uncharacterized protein n=1 Tax=Ridgeia piscesae TaxID=27915 RepID=A0AAD9PAQ4_RIDPI|nr:hypothetical protein NP493_56g00031 [Ridgeia piscesae]
MIIIQTQKSRKRHCRRQPTVLSTVQQTTSSHQLVFMDVQQNHFNIQNVEYYKNGGYVYIFNNSVHVCIYNQQTNNLDIIQVIRKIKLPQILTYIASVVPYEINQSY